MAFQFTVAVSNIVNALQQYGFVDFIIPFILIFAVVYALLQQAKLFGTGDEPKKYNLVIALAIGLIITIPHVLNPQPNDAVSIMQRYLPEFVYLALAIILMLMLLGLFTAEPGTKGLISGIAGIIAVLYLIIVVFSSIAGYSIPLAVFQDPNLVAVIIIILVFALVIWWVTKKDGGGGGLNTFEKYVKALLGRD